MYDFFNDLSVLGWFGVAMWASVPLGIFLRPQWFFNYEERKPKLEAFREFTLTLEKQVLFMVIRFIVICLGVGVIGGLLVAI